ncbi:efflux RND transporter periplasmic adaptor subunit [Mangrovimonas spongiae]|uniref:Efflux RND transporter periplasmic adaptor subunit n=1 Tax=Mangrovimonas spongiae TaxID=2494697 RepID=A0A3R9NRT7_9FLAO|nr:efflux RND transporter periplasmic adaptor subunit [Mangrovimonas spongiae]RSK40277.1 efflux RND transporter periplasmic adaptor subunit [Mangrovimonas spongiae]
MKKYLIYLAILVVGLFLGWLLFGDKSNEEINHNHDEVSQADQMWTCSMHPQIMQPEPGDCPICGMDLIPAEAGADGLTKDQFKLTRNAMALANIQTTIVGEDNIENNDITLSGKIAENEEANSVQVSYFSGRIERLNVNSTGETISKGQLLASIYSPELYAAQQELITASSLKESQPELYKAVRNKLKLWKLSDSQINAIETSGKPKEKFSVYATVSGTVTEKLVDQGDYIKQGQPLLKIANLNTVWANFDIYENQIDYFKKGQSVSILSNAYPDKVFKGKVDFIDPILNTNTRTVTLRVVLNNTDEMFKPGMFVKGTIEGILGNGSEAVITVPASAVLWTGKRSVVYLKSNSDAPVFEMREITLGHKNGDSYQVIEGLNNGDEIVTNGTFTVDAAAQLQGKKSMMNHKSNPQDNTMVMTMELSEDFKKQFITLLPTYLNLKDAFVESHTKNVSTLAKKMLSKLQNVNQEKVSKMLQNHLSKSIEMVENISQTNNLEKQRAAFVILNDNIVAIAKNLNGLESTLYVQRCPMANNNKGAVWLSTEKEVRNPYFGDAMLTCGEVKQVIQ